MGAISFDQPSKGTVSTAQNALEVDNDDTGTGVYGRSEKGEGLHGDSNAPDRAAVAGINLNAAR